MANTFEPARLEYCMGPQVIEHHLYPIGRLVNYAACLSVAQSAFRIYWRRAGTTLHKMHKLKPYPDSARVVAHDGSEICRWSIDDELRLPDDACHVGSRPEKAQA
jgi:hypothetical protein